MWRGLDKTFGAVPAALVVIALVAAGDARGATGELAFAQCIEDEDSGSEGAACTNAPGLSGAQSVTVSEDGKSVYVASAYDGVIARFNRNPATGELAFAQCVEDEDEDLGGEECTQAPGLYGAASVAVSVDGRSVYASSAYDDAIVRFDRDPATGELAFAQCFDDEDSDLEQEGCVSVPGLFGATSVAVSEDGNSLYTAAIWNDAIVRFDRNPTSGELTFVECIEDEDTNPEAGDCANAPGLFGATSVAISGDGVSLYVTSAFDGAVAGFDRDTAGALAFAECIEDQEDGLEGDVCANAPGLFGAASVAVSEDGSSLYTASKYDDAIDRFNRSEAGGLTFVQCIEDEDTDPEPGACTDAPGLFGAQSVAVSGDGRSLYAASLWDDAMVRLDRNPTTGALAFAQCFDDHDTNPEQARCAGAPGLFGASGVTAGPDGESIYTASAFDGALDRFGWKPPTPPPPQPPAPAGNGDQQAGNAFEIAKVRRNKKKGTAKLVVRVPGPGGLELARNKKVKVPVKPRRKGRRKLTQNGRVRVNASLTYAPEGGDPNTKRTRVKLVKR